MIPTGLYAVDPGAFPARGPLSRPAIIEPAPRQVSYGEVSGRVSAGTTFVVVKVDGVVRARGIPFRRQFRFNLSLPRRDVRVRVVAVGALGDRRARVVSPVFGLPRAASPLGPRPTLEDSALATRIEDLTRGYAGTAAAYVEDLRSRRGAAWNARARFPAASTVKVAIALDVLRNVRGPPARGSSLDRLLWEMLVHSDNAAANALLTWLGGSTSSGSASVNETLRALGIRDTYLYGGYVLDVAAPPTIPLRVDEQPAIGIGKYTTAFDLARIHRVVYLASAGRGPAVRLPGGFTSAEARFLLWILAHVEDPGKLDRYLAPNLPVVHKAGWISQARHDAGIVFWAGGAYVATVMTWNSFGADSSSDVLAGRVAAAALRRYKELRNVGAGSPARLVSTA